MKGFPAFLTLVLCATLVTGCAATSTGTPVTLGPVPTGSISGGHEDLPRYDADPSTVVIELTEGHATVAGDQGSSSLRVYGDGRVERSAEDGIGTVRLKLDDAGVGTLLTAADRRELLSDPDLGDVMISDVGSTSLTIRLQDRVIELDVIGPGITGVGSPSVEQARAEFSAFVAQLWTLDGVGIGEPARTVCPRGVVITASLVTSSSSDVPWPFIHPARSVFAISSCPVVTGDDVQRLVRLLTEQKASASDRHGEFRVATGDASVPTLLVRVSSTNQPCMPSPMKPGALPRLPWPADDREWARQWQHWQVVGALDRAAGSLELPIGGADDLGNYDLDLVSGTVKGAPVVDVVATPDSEHTGRADVPGFVCPVALPEGELPVVTKTVES